MDCKTVKGAAQATGMPVALTFDPYAEPARAWVVAIGETFQGAGATPEQALDAAVRALEAPLAARPQPAPGAQRTAAQ